MSKNPTPDLSETTVTAKPRVSVVVEWENALLSDARRTASMLRQLRRQASEISVTTGDERVESKKTPFVELLVIYDEAELTERELSDLLGRCLGDADHVLGWQLVPTADSGYYRNKNLGASKAAGETIVFLDSDVIPEPGWLEQLLGTLEDPEVRVVAGTTYIDPEGLVSKAFALFWFFPLRSDVGPPKCEQFFFSNNLAARKAFLEQYPYPEMSGTSRGACLVLAEQLTRAGVTVFSNPQARVRHPAPNGVAHISKRALAQGRDRVLRERALGNHWKASWPASFLMLAANWGGSIWRIVTGFRHVSLNPLLIPAAVAIAAYYYLLYFVGEMMLHLHIPAIRRIRV